MTLGELLVFIKGQLRRPDKEDLINENTISAIRALHSTVKFDNDFTEFIIPTIDITFNVDDNSVGEFEYSRDVRVPDSIIAKDINGDKIAEVKLLTSREIIKRQNSRVSVENTAYKQGNRKISFNVSAVPSTFVLGAFTHRPEFAITNNANGTTKSFTDETLLAYTTWLLDMYSVPVQDYVIGYVAARLGEKDISNTHLGMYRTVHEPILRELGRG